ncbi:hypothetical protein Sinac_7332 [Singulisphaera acidiphila DSM 18658]|uniref:Uncharacterized protein n=6 Tax=Singulisphaera acidiphila TaxID=466153 RepID=L0DSN3_SINAD|nr:hypothetical protein Sinac_7332 [Singulisphaera acidiphila DSM 18658]
MTVEVSWKVPPSSSPVENAGLDLEVSEGRIVDALVWPARSRGGPVPRANGWRLGNDSTGRVRARIEAPLTASLLFRSGGQVVRLPFLAILDGPQRLVTPPSLEIGVERVGWDAIAVDLEQGDGTAAPGAMVPVSIAFNVLTPEPTEVALKCSAELIPYRGGDPVWRQELHDVVATDVLAPTGKVWNMPAPKAEGTYILEVRTSWEPLANLESSRLVRWIRRRRNPVAATSAVRRVALTVVGSSPAKWDKDASGVAEQEVEMIDLARLRGERPSASGRAPVQVSGGVAWSVPEAALVEAPRRDRLRGWITRAGSETAVLPASTPAGLAWSALGLKVPNPGRPHRLSVTVTGGHPSALGVALIDSGGGRGRPRVLLDACASGPPILEGTPVASFSWLVWPDDASPVLVLVNRDAVAPVQLGSVTLTELPGLPAPPTITEPSGSPGRGLGLYLAGPELLDRFGGGTVPGDPLALSLNVARYLTYCGASTIIMPEDLADRSQRRALDGQACEDPTGPDRLDLLLRILERQGLTAWLELATDGPLPGLPAPDSAEALAKGLVRVDRNGLADGPAYHPLNPEVREALKGRVAKVISTRKTRPALAGLLIRLGPGPTLLGGPDTGMDDLTFARFVRETFGPEASRDIPGLGTTAPGRFEARSRFLAGPGRMPWLTWRSRGIGALYTELSATVHRTAPGATLAVATPALDDGPAGDEARRVDLAGLAPSQAWRAVGLDLETWPTGEEVPVVLRGVGLSADELSHDLATSPELDAPVIARAGRGVLVGLEEPGARIGGSRSPAAQVRAGGGRGLRLTAMPLPEGATGDELMGHAVAALDARWVMLASSAVAGHEERVRQFARVFRALPASSASPTPLDRQPFGVAVRTLRSGTSTYVSLANDTPYPVRVETLLGSRSATVEDLGRSLRLAPEVVGEGSRLVLDLHPFGVAAIRVGAPQVKVGPVTPYPSEAVLAGMQARYDEISTQLARLSRTPPGGVVAGPPNPGFEPAATPVVQLAGVHEPTPPGGWRLLDDEAGTAEIDTEQPHTGRGSLRLNAETPPAVILSDAFPAKGYAALTVQAWFRSDHADAKVRLWIEGEGGGQPYRRWSELTVQPDWVAHAVRGSELPADGLAAARIRFELLTPGSLWVDDLRIAGAVPTEPERENTRRVLLAALHAYRKKQYAEFARLAGSHWVRSSSSVAVRAAEPTTADHAEMIRTGKATALPSNSLLR